MIQSEKLSNHLLLFFRYLRDKEFLIGTKEMSDGLRALEFIDIANLQQFRLALRIVLCSSKEEQERFDEAFIKFFLNGNNSENTKEMLHFLSEEKRKSDATNEVNQKKESEKNSPTNPTVSGIHQNQIANGSSGEEQRKVHVWAATNIMNKEAQEIKVYVSSHQFQSMEKAAKTFVHRINLKRSRRYQVSKKGLKFDLRKTLRQSIQLGGYPIKPVWTGPVKQKANFILLCDSSRSMSSYAEPFLQFAYALTKCSNNVEVFLFSTKLRRVTDQFKKAKQGEFPVLTIVGDEYGGGTRIGESLYSFVQRYGMYLRRNTVVLIASDGLDAGEIDQLQGAMKEIRQRTTSVIWLNPLLNIDGYEPTARGMKAALPYIDLFSGATTAKSFLKLANTISIRR
ncbi:vWA domain-containing protein [Sporosarcina sp. G11-34]|uniref:vWA domain-containing protein n=1 Tax=Sporosarcina sp. G11-34 TaxID=2849605 RepID=UPI0022A9C372|nr:VWA domain-containing protein [Sporosarcina sp. G11-34]MCZ2258186.1 VWA domain-containing protein [Sporosarcina sp. G11-34]